MKIEIERPAEVLTDRTIAGLMAIIKHGKAAKNISEFMNLASTDTNIQSLDFFIYNGASHIAVHEYFPNGEKSERILFIHN